MNSIFLNNYTIVYLFSELLTFIVSLLLLFISLKLLLKWDFNSTSSYQYKLEKLAYLGSTMALFIYISKLIIFIYFIYTIDGLSLFIPGAMCGAGVISANSYGLLLLGIKVLTLFLLTLWIVLNQFDIKEKYYPILKEKSLLLVVISILIIIELIIDVNYFNNIDTSSPVSCCSTLFGNLEGQNPLPFNLSIQSMLTLYFTLTFAFIVSILIDNKLTTVIIAPLFLTISYYSIVYFFGTYIYEQPTHKCPFCMMQKEYHYIGYLLWLTLFFGTTFASIWAIVAIWLKKEYKKLKRVAVALILLSFLLNCSYVLIYYIKNGVFL